MHFSLTFFLPRCTLLFSATVPALGLAIVSPLAKPSPAEGRGGGREAGPGEAGGGGGSGVPNRAAACSANETKEDEEEEEEEDDGSDFPAGDEDKRRRCKRVHSSFSFAEEAD